MIHLKQFTLWIFEPRQISPCTILRPVIIGPQTSYIQTEQSTYLAICLISCSVAGYLNTL